MSCREKKNPTNQRPNTRRRTWVMRGGEGREGGKEGGREGGREG